MAEYTPLMLDEDVDTKRIEKRSRPRLVFCGLSITMLTVLLSLAIHIDVLFGPPVHQQTLLGAKNVETHFENVTPSPNLLQGHEIMRKNRFKFPQMVFPALFIRVSAEEPNKFYRPSSSVVLSQTDSMIYRWKTKSNWPTCYLTGWVSPRAELSAGNKSYSARGDMTAIQVWLVEATRSPNLDLSKSGVSWNTKPHRISLLGTLNFTSHADQEGRSYLDGQELKPPTPRFPCLGQTEITVELAFGDDCVGCRLQFEQVFSMPPLGFELMQLA
ncbi:hypothetical protein MIND_00826600 [Mycena indigotica]|uniref:Ubiquitin 3 binding protein But2 C-terminal domain-containing protein n=1 Tax=Mycena indigotica TaxID=2126181 RepID=A0A8H6SFS6_9AGAR|nr:uncharacterized protein MIND_00826600 [Mycena indigotica]KAF7298790.1 hypothetical protein MIND_00826600 [Mycena indigotica]